jgi:hypothetical protein
VLIFRREATSMTLNPAPLEAARVELGLSIPDLWRRCFALGGLLDQVALSDALVGRQAFSRVEFDVVAQALNERFMDDGANHPVPYADS